MKRVAWLVALAFVVGQGSLGIQVVEAQPAGAIGHPLPDNKLPQGTVTVRVVAGAPMAVVDGADVTLMVNGVPRTARTDGSGRATFGGLPDGATVQASVKDSENNDQSSEAFPIPENSGVRLMLSTKPFGGMGGDDVDAAQQMIGAAQGPRGTPPPPRMMSGQPRPDQDTKPGSYQVRLTYNSMKVDSGKAVDPAPPTGEHVTLVGYAYDNSVDVKTVPVSAQGTVLFDKLDVTGGTVYFALSRLPRNGGYDRLMSVPVQPPTELGVKAILSSETRDSTASFIDDLSPTSSVAPGVVRVLLDGAPADGDPIILMNAATHTEVARMVPVMAPPDPNEVDMQGGVNDDASLPPGKVVVTVIGGPLADRNAKPAPLPNIVVKIERATEADGGDDADDATPELKSEPPASAGSASGSAGSGSGSAVAPEAAVGVITGTTDAAGTVTLTAPPGVPAKITVIVNGKDIVTSPVDLSKSGTRLNIEADWIARPEARFAVPYDPSAVYYVESRMRGQYYRSQPFQTLPTKGAQVSLNITPRILFNFRLESFVEDELMAFRGVFIVQNYSFIPYKASPDGLLIPLPRHFKGGVVHEDNQKEVSVVANEGLRVLRPIAPGAMRFVAGFSMPADRGTVNWSLDLPMGAWNSSILVKKTATMDLHLPLGTKGRLVPMKDGSPPQYLISDITIMPQQSMVMQITGLPTQPWWKVWAPRFAGILVLLFIGGAFAAVMWTRLRARPTLQPLDARKAQRDQLLEELVALEQSGADPERREQLVAALEQLWD